MVVGQRVKIVTESHPWCGMRGVVTEIDHRLQIPLRVVLEPGRGRYREAKREWPAAARMSDVKMIAGPLVEVPKPALYCTAGHRMTGDHPSYERQKALNQCPHLVRGYSHSHAREMRPCHRNFARGYA